MPERNLDVLRALAVLAVLVYHVCLTLGVRGFLSRHALGRVGVLAFFVHTSVVLLQSLERADSGRYWIRAFYLRRAWRIYPLAAMTIAVALVARVQEARPVSALGPFVRPSGSAIASNLLLIQNLTAHAPVLGVLWTLPLELQMYLMLPLCFIAAGRGMWLVLGLMALSMVVALAWIAHLPGGFLTRRLTVLEFIPCFLAGVLAWAGMRRRLVRPRVVSFAWLPALLVVGVLFVWAVPASYKQIPSVFMGEWAVCLAIALGLVVICELSPSALTSGAAVIARYSYGVYLLHPVALWLGFIVWRDEPPAVQWATFGVSVVLLPWLAYHGIEEPGIRVGKRLAARVVARRLREPKAPAPLEVGRG
jgi:peptidoglycan/LPS O-acetylase OafA/YrhL